MTSARLLTVWVLLVLGALAIDGLVLYLAYHLVAAWLTWPVVRFALSVGLFGVCLFWVSEQYAEMRVNAQERQR